MASLSPPEPQHADPTAAAGHPDEAPARAESRGEPPRIRFMGLGVSRASSGRCRATVTLERVDGERVEGAADVEASAAGDLRAGATATLEALRRASRTGHRFTLLGVKSVRAFDRHVVLVQLGVTGAGAGAAAPAQLVGSAFADGDLMRATVLAVLNASNRVLWAPHGR
jgi:hypothetical protein